MKSLYETHLHTVEASACGRVSGSDYIDFMKNKGFQGMIVTDHFFNGNSCVPRDLSWDKRVRQYMSGYRKALEAAEGKDFDVLFGVEYCFEGDEYLIYGVDGRWLLQNDDILGCSREEVYRRVHEEGGIMVQAHPYRDRHYLSEIILAGEITDAVEIYNAANPDNENALGYQYAKELDVPVTAGSDLHFFHENALGGMLLPHRISDIGEYVSMVMNREGIPVKVKDGEATPVRELPELIEPVEGPTLPVRIYHGQD